MIMAAAHCEKRVNMIKAMSFGAILWDIIGDEQHIGGCTLNLIAHLNKLGMKGYMYTKLGTDELGKRALGEIEELGVESSFVQMDDTKSTGYAKIILDENKVPSYEFASNAGHEFIEVNEEQIERIKEEQIDIFCYGTYCQSGEMTRKNLLKILRECSFPCVFCDINLRVENPSKEMLEGSLQYADILKLNEDEVTVLAEVLYGGSLEEAGLIERICRDYQIRLVCVTKGADGCVIYEEGRSPVSVAAEKIDAADTVGAGDAFAAGFIFSYYKGLPITQCGEKGNLLGGYVATQKGAIPEYSESIKSHFNL